ncbi:unnamed protein product [Schistosoma margrebowiei]|uniref:Uncharacterized protein n=1 Tax=Schistosoma margrebowiei TaxID=48269 RepID=A0A183LR07_9TREM|nr:unnamed protein product [Schistosoma margrebowiei]
MKDVRTRRGADIALNHHLVVAKMKLNLKKQWTDGETALQNYGTVFVRGTDKLNRLKIALNNRFQDSQDPLESKGNAIENN